MNVTTSCCELDASLATGMSADVRLPPESAVAAVTTTADVDPAAMPDGVVSTDEGTQGTPQQGVKRPAADMLADTSQPAAAAVDRWEACSSCGLWVSLGEAAQVECPHCGTGIRRKHHKAVEHWVQCDKCGRWRSLPEAMAAALAPDEPWECSMRAPGMTCRSARAAFDRAGVGRRPTARRKLTPSEALALLAAANPGGGGLWGPGGGEEGAGQAGEGDASGGPGGGGEGGEGGPVPNQAEVLTSAQLLLLCRAPPPVWDPSPRCWPCPAEGDALPAAQPTAAAAAAAAVDAGQEAAQVAASPCVGDEPLAAAACQQKQQQELVAGKQQEGKQQQQQAGDQQDEHDGKQQQQQQQQWGSQQGKQALVAPAAGEASEAATSADGTAVVAACSWQQDGADSALQGAGRVAPTFNQGSPGDIQAAAAATDPGTPIEGGGMDPPQASNSATAAAAGSGVGGEAGGGVAPVSAEAGGGVDPVRAAGCWQLWQADAGVLGEGWVEYIPGRDTVLTPCELATGLHVTDADTGAHVLSCTALPPEVLPGLRPVMGRLLALAAAGALPEVTDGRVSAGPVDLRAFLALPRTQLLLQEALQRRLHRLSVSGGGGGPTALSHHLRYLVHVSPDSRKVYIGEVGDTTSSGAPRMSFSKAWRSAPITSWSGGCKLADMPGSRANRVVRGPLTALLGPAEAALHAVATQLWGAFRAQPHTAAAAARMEAALAEQVAAHGAAAYRLGDSAWNAYSLNIDYRTAAHLDAKNMPGSYSALLVLEVGKSFAGGFYMMPQYRRALDLRQGVVCFHRSGDATVGCHGNAPLWCPAPTSHRVSLVLYQTSLGPPPPPAAPPTAAQDLSANPVPAEGAPAAAMSAEGAPGGGQVAGEAAAGGVAGPQTAAEGATAMSGAAAMEVERPAAGRPSSSAGAGAAEAPDAPAAPTAGGTNNPTQLPFSGLSYQQQQQVLQAMPPRLAAHLQQLAAQLEAAAQQQRGDPQQALAAAWLAGAAVGTAVRPATTAPPPAAVDSPAAAAAAGAAGALAPIAALDVTHPSGVPGSRRVVGPVPGPAQGTLLAPALRPRGHPVTPMQEPASRAPSKTSADKPVPNSSDAAGAATQQVDTWHKQQQQHGGGSNVGPPTAADSTPDTRSCRDQAHNTEQQHVDMGMACSNCHVGQLQQQPEEEEWQQGRDTAATGGAAGAGWLQAWGSRVTQWWSGAGDQQEGAPGHPPSDMVP